MSKFSEIEHNFLQLLYSDQESNVTLALEIGKNIPELTLTKRLQAYGSLYKYFFGEVLPQVEAKHILELALNTRAMVYRISGDPAFFFTLTTKPNRFEPFYIPPEIKHYPHLTKLILEKHLLSSIPPEIGALTKLEILGLSKNLIVDLPPELSQLQTLRVLDLSCNFMDKLPGVVGGIRNLEKLHLQGNCLIELPQEMSQLKKLAFLDLSHNYFEALPNVVIQMESLTHLDLSYNYLNELPLGIQQLQHLTRLDLSFNRFKTLPSGVLDLEHLEELQMTHLKMRITIKDLKQLKALKNLYITNYALINRTKILAKWYLPRCRVIVDQQNPWILRWQSIKEWISAPLSEVGRTIGYGIAKVLYKTKLPLAHRIADILTAHPMG